MALIPIAASFCFLLELGFTPLCLPVIQDEFSLSRSEVAQIVSLFLLASAILIVPFGILSRYIAAETIFIAGLMIFGVGILEFVLSDSKSWLLASRCVQGFGAAMFAPMIPVMLMSIDRARGGFLLAMWASCSGLVSAIAPFTAGIIVAYGSWRTAQLVILVVAIVATLAYTVLWNVEDRRNRNRKDISIPLLACRKNVVVLVYVFLTYAMTTFLIVYGSIELREDGWLLTGLGMLMTVMWMSFSATSVAIRNSIYETGISRLLLTNRGALGFSGYCACSGASCGSLRVFGVRVSRRGDGLE